MKKSRKPAELPRFAELEAEYEILRELGRGGTAVVYLALERELGRHVAIKVIRTAYVEDEEAAARLVREARTVGRLQHPNIVMLYGTRRLQDRSLALIMQYIEGRTLKAEIQAEGPLPADRAERVLRDLGAALAYAHRRRIVHRDLKPENVYIDELGGARLSDFGIARPWGTDSSLTLPGAALGTPAYMSPEQIDGGLLDGRSDLYSLGLVGYEMLTGKRPWAGESLFGIIYKQKHEQLPSLTLERPELPPGLVAAIEGALHKDADQRWPDADAFLAALDGQPTTPGARAAATRPGNTLPEEPAARAAAAAVLLPPASQPDPDALTIQYRRPSDDAAMAIPVGGGTVAPAGWAIVEQPDERADEAPGATAAARGWRRPRLLAAAVLVFFLLGTAVLMGINQWGSAPARPVGPANAAAAPTPAPAPAPEERGAPQLAAMWGALQEGTAGDTLAEPLVVRVADAGGHPVAGAQVRFVVIEGEGEIEPATAQTGADGTARARWRPLAAGVHVAEAQLADGDAVAARFQARALGRPPARFSRVSAEVIRGTAGAAAEPLVVRVEDEEGRALSGVPVRFLVREGEGTVDRQVVTGADGRAAARWVLGSEDQQEVVATVEGLPEDTIVFRANSTPAPLAVRRTVAAGGTHSCVLGGNGSASCWGGNDSGQLGDGSSSRHAEPVSVRAPEPFALLSAGVSHTCAVAVSGSTYCWGANASGQLGNGGRSGAREPVKVRVAEGFTSVVAGMSHTCGLGAGGQLFCWGRNGQGQLGDGTRSNRATPVRAGGSRTFRSVTLGWSHTCALGGDGGAYCWGSNNFGQLGDGTTTERTQPVAVAGGHRFTRLAAGSGHTCGLRADGAVLCWGQGAQGQLGTGSRSNSSAPVSVDLSEPASTITAGGVHTCALTRGGDAFCWGRNNYGQLGDGTFEDRPRPTPVDSGRRFTALAASGAHTCASASGGQEFCWGFNLDGQLGDGSRTNRPHPVIVRRDR